MGSTIGVPSRASALKAMLPVISLWLLCSACGAAHAAGNDSVLTEPETGARYPADVTFVRGGTRYHLSATGVAVRTKFWFTVYSIAHYLEAGPDATQAQVLARIMSDDTAKQVTLEFARDLEAGQVRDGFVESLTQHASLEEMRATGPALQEFLRTVRKDVAQGERFTVRWLPGGRLICLHGGKVVSEISSRTFARVFWSVWFGEAPIVDREQLIVLRVLEPAASLEEASPHMPIASTR